MGETQTFASCSKTTARVTRKSLDGFLFVDFCFDMFDHLRLLRWSGDAL